MKRHVAPSKVFDAVDRVKDEFASASDRAAAIVGASFLEEVSAQLIRAHLAPHAKTDATIWTGSGALATFSARIDIALRLGLIGEDEHARLHQVRKIRNDFAHRLEVRSFEDSSVRDHCRNLRVPTSMLIPDEYLFADMERRDGSGVGARVVDGAARALFEHAVLNLMYCLATRLMVATARKKTVPADFKDAHEVVDLAVSTLRSLLHENRKLSAALGRDGAQTENDQEYERHAVRAERFAAFLRSVHSKSAD